MRSPYELFFSDDDTSETKHKKKIVITMCVVASFVTFSASPTKEFDAALALGLTASVCSVALLIRWYITKRIADSEAVFFMLIWFIVVLSSDLILLSEMGEPVWPATVVLLDAILLCRLPQSIGTAFVVMVCLYLITVGIERASRFGLFDITGGIKMRGIGGCFNITPEEISATPCQLMVSDAFMSTVFYLGVFLMDYFATRSFAVGMQREKAKLQASVSLAETVVAALVRFDLEEAATCIGNEEHTPLSEVLNRLLQNLHQYRPYLPDSLFELSNENGYQVAVRPPQDHVAIIFTDLKSSTCLWEASPDAMKRALKIHNNIIRSCLGDYGGYEVKTIGDAFMVAFEDMTSGCWFAMAVQEKIMSTTWPTELILPDNFISNGWNGLVLRIGIHFGEVTTEVSELTGRTDYFGRTVNRAARLEGACTPGGIAIDMALLCHVPTAEEWYHETTAEILKGIDENPVEIIILRLEVSKRRILSSPNIPSADDILFPSSYTPISVMEHIFSATTCVMRLDIVTIPQQQSFQEYVNGILSRAVSCLERTEGSIIAVVSSFITIGWNTVRATPTHVENSVRFTSLMYSTFSSPGEIFIGLSSSPVHCGTVGTKEQRFVTVFGDCVAACGLLCQACYDIGAFALSTSKAMERFPVRPVDVWTERHETIYVYELQAHKLCNYFSALTSTFLLEKCGILQRSLIEWGWSDQYSSAFDRRDWETIRTMAPNDEVLLKVSDMLRRGKSLRVLS